MIHYFIYNLIASEMRSKCIENSVFIQTQKNIMLQGIHHNQQSRYHLSTRKTLWSNIVLISLTTKERKTKLSRHFLYSERNYDTKIRFLKSHFDFFNKSEQHQQ